MSEKKFQFNKSANTLLQHRLNVEKSQRDLRISRFLSQNPGYSKKISQPNLGVRELIDVLPNGEYIYAKLIMPAPRSPQELINFIMAAV